MKRKLQGHTVIEAAFVLPLVIIVIIFMIFTAVFISQRMVLEGKMQKIASIAAQEKVRANSHTSYLTGKVYGYNVNDAVYVDSYNTSHPYRLFFGNGNEMSVVRDHANSNDLKLSAFGFLGDIELNEEGTFLRKRVILKLSYSLNSIKMFKLLGLNQLTNRIYSEIVVDVPITEPTEIVRSLDIAADIWKYFSQKVENSKSSEFLKQALSKLNIVIEIFKK